MGANSKIEWTTHTFNPWRGCSKVAEGCKFCYAERDAKRFPDKLGIWGPNGTRVLASDEMCCIRFAKDWGFGGSPKRMKESA